MLRTIYWIIFGAITTLIGFIIFVIGFIFDKSGKTGEWISHLWGRILLNLSGSSVEIIGLENLIWDRPCVLVSNHQSAFDIFIYFGYIPIKFRWVAKKSLFNLPLVGLGMKLRGDIAIDRENNRSALESINKAIDEVRNGKSIIIFPEGTRSEDGTIGEFKRGSLVIATKAEVPIIPITIKGSIDILSKKGKRIKKSKVKVIIDKPIETKGLNREDQNKLLDDVREIIVKNYSN